MSNPIVIEDRFHISPDKVWQAITNKVQMKEWYFDIPDFELKVNSTFNFYEPGGAKKYHHRCTIKEILPNRKLQHTWTHPSHSKGESLLTWELFQVEDYTTVKLTHEGIENFADGGSDFTRENYIMGWNEIVGKSLKSFLEFLP
jgi:uncharacterized protein YndB with AHSA1/START domain